MIKIFNKNKFIWVCLGNLFFLVVLVMSFFLYQRQKEANIQKNEYQAEQNQQELLVVKDTNEIGNKEIKEIPLVKYENQRYRYSIIFPDNWYINNDSSESPLEKLQEEDLIDIPFGGQTFWSNYKDINQYSPENKPADFRLLNLTIYSRENLSPEDFIKKLGFETDFEKKDLQSDKSAIGLELRSEGIVAENPKTVFVFWNDQYFYVFNLAFSGGDVAITEEMRKIVLSFELKK